MPVNLSGERPSQVGCRDGRVGGDLTTQGGMGTQMPQQELSPKLVEILTISGSLSMPRRRAMWVWAPTLGFRNDALASDNHLKDRCAREGMDVFGGG